MHGIYDKMYLSGNERKPYEEVELWQEEKTNTLELRRRKT